MDPGLQIGVELVHKNRFAPLIYPVGQDLHRTAARWIPEKTYPITFKAAPTGDRDVADDDVSIIDVLGSDGLIGESIKVTAFATVYQRTIRNNCERLVADQRGAHHAWVFILIRLITTGPARRHAPSLAVAAPRAACGSSEILPFVVLNVIANETGVAGTPRETIGRHLPGSLVSVGEPSRPCSP